MATTTTEEPTTTELWEAELSVRKNPELAQATSDAAAAKESSAQVEAPPAPTLEERFAALEAQNQILKQELSRTTGRVSTLQSQLAKGESAAAAVKTAPTPAAQAAAVEDPEEWKKLMQDFPEWGTAVQKKLDATLTAMRNTQAAPAPAGVDAAAVESTVQNALALAEINRVNRKYPDWSTTVKTQEFTNWYSKQPDAVKALAGSPYSDDAIDMLAKFAADDTAAKAAALNTRRQSVLEVGAGNKTAATTPPKQVSEGDLTAKELWDLERQQRDQRRKLNGVR